MQVLGLHKKNQFQTEICPSFNLIGYGSCIGLEVYSSPNKALFRENFRILGSGSATGSERYRYCRQTVRILGRKEYLKFRIG